MQVSETVRTLAQAISATRTTLSPRHRLLLALLQLMPLYCEARRLDAWEAAILAALPRVNDRSDADTSGMGHLLEEVFEFGRLNLYTSFDSSGTGDCYANLSKLFERANIDCPKINHFTGL